MPELGTNLVTQASADVAKEVIQTTDTVVTSQAAGGATAQNASNLRKSGKFIKDLFISGYDDAAGLGANMNGLKAFGSVMLALYLGFEALNYGHMAWKMDKGVHDTSSIFNNGVKGSACFLGSLMAAGPWIAAATKMPKTGYLSMILNVGKRCPALILPLCAIPFLINQAEKADQGGKTVLDLFNAGIGNRAGRDDSIFGGGDFALMRLVRWGREHFDPKYLGRHHISLGSYSGSAMTIVNDTNKLLNEERVFSTGERKEVAVG